MGSATLVVDTCYLAFLNALSYLSATVTDLQAKVKYLEEMNKNQKEEVSELDIQLEWEHT